MTVSSVIEKRIDDSTSTASRSVRERVGSSRPVVLTVMRRDRFDSGRTGRGGSGPKVQPEYPLQGDSVSSGQASHKREGRRSAGLLETARTRLGQRSPAM